MHHLGITSIPFALLVALPFLFSCGDTTQSDEPDASPDGAPATWTIELSPSAPSAVELTADDVADYLTRMGLTVERINATGIVECQSGVGRVVFLGDELGEVILGEEATDQTWRVEETRCGSGRLFALSGGGLFGRQYAGYEWMHLLGVRFFHPEEEYIPLEPAFTDEPLFVEHTPDFRYRSVSLHLTHPLALGDAFRLQDERYFDEALRYIDWQIKNGASYGSSGVGSGDFSTYGLDRGYMRSAGLNLHQVQQGGRPVVDPDDPTPVEEQIERAIRNVMDVDPQPDMFSFGVSVSEFSEIPDTQAVEEMTFVADFFAEHYPEVMLMINNHGTHEEPGETYGVRFGDLSQFAPANLGVKVHTLMFYDLERPAPVYGNEDFHFLYDYMESEYQTRRLWYFPESAWWLTFDNTIPLYLPITIEARDRDIQKIAHMLDGQLDGHRVFGSGHEWGYWQNEYCSFRMAADISYRWTDCLTDITTPMGEAAAEVQAVVEEVVAHQETVFFDADRIAYLVGSDPETELAAATGIVFHPLPPAPQQILRWSEEQLVEWNQQILPFLQEMDQAYAGFVERLDAVEEQVEVAAQNIYDEIRDGVEVTGLRARHAWQIYGSLVALREAQLSGDPTDTAETLLADALVTTGEAIAVIHRREEGFRYSPIERSIAGGPDGDQDQNWTIYGYRVHNRTHHGYYYTRIDRLTEQAFAGSDETIALQDALITTDEALLIRVLDEAISDVSIQWGDGETGSGESPLEHTYDAAGAYSVEVTGVDDGDSFELVFDIAVLTEELHTGFSGTVISPSGAEMIESVIPGLVFGPIDDNRVAVGFALETENHFVNYLHWGNILSAEGDAVFENQPSAIEVPIINRSAGEVMAYVTVGGAVTTLTDRDGPLSLVGDLPPEDVVRALVAIGGFDEEGARGMVASMLGYTPENMPETLDFAMEFEVQAD